MGNSISMRSYFITGGAGFIGREIVRQLLAKPDTNHIVCLTRGKRADYLQHPKLSFWHGDITDCIFPIEEFTDVIHGACDANDLHYQDSKDIYYTSIEGTARILQLIENIGANCVVLSSGAATRNTVYGRAKRICETLCGHEIKIARIFSVIGEEMPLNGQFAAGKFIWQAINEGKVSIYGPGTSERTYLHVSDCAKWILNILDNGHSGVPYDVAGNESVSIRWLAMEIARIWNVPVIDIDGPDRCDKYEPDLTLAIDIGCKQTLTLRHSLEQIHDNRI